MTTETRQRKSLPEQHAQHVYRSSVPARASAPVTGKPPASQHHAGHYAGIHPDDTPYTTGNKTPLSGQPQTQPPLEEEDAYTVPPLPRSARRYRQSPAQENATVVPTRRRGHMAFYSLIVASSVVAGIVIALVVPPIWQRSSDQMHYGFPRTWQTDANVGHGTAQFPDDHFIALNNHGYVEVLEIPEGVPDRNHPPQIYLVARPDSPDADQAPATLTFEEVNGDGKVDMVVHCNGNKTILYNDGHSFKETP